MTGRQEFTRRVLFRVAEMIRGVADDSTQETEADAAIVRFFHRLADRIQGMAIP